jgi:hypothetical protein
MPMATLLEQLDAMCTLRANWDGYNADPPRAEVLDVAKEFVALMLAVRGSSPTDDVRVHPGRAGGVQIEWEDERGEHELDIEVDGFWGFLHVDRATGTMTEHMFGPVQQVVHPGVLKELRELVAA